MYVTMYRIDSRITMIFIREEPVKAKIKKKINNDDW